LSLKRKFLRFCIDPYLRFRDEHIQGDLGTKVNILGGDTAGYFEKKVYINMCVNLNGYRDTAV
jgi:hypothetical protein